MSAKQQAVAFYTLVRREWIRTFRVWVSTLLSPIITTVLYFVIFGHVIGSRVGMMEGYPYLKFIAPGLIMMSIISNSYAASVSAFFSMKFQRDIEELLVTPMKNWVILSGFVVAGIVRGILVGSIVTVISLLFTHLSVHSLFGIIAGVLLSSGIFALAGVLNALYAKTFDHITLIPSFVIVPLTYLGGVFYSISLLPPVWKYISMINPIAYIIHAFRFAVLGVGSYHIQIAYVVMLLIFIALFWLALSFIRRGFGLKV